MMDNLYVDLTVSQTLIVTTNNVDISNYLVKQGFLLYVLDDILSGDRSCDIDVLAKVVKSHLSVGEHVVFLGKHVSTDISYFNNGVYPLYYPLYLIATSFVIVTDDHVYKNVAKDNPTVVNMIADCKLKTKEIQH